MAAIKVVWVSCAIGMLGMCDTVNIGELAAVGQEVDVEQPGGGQGGIIKVRAGAGARFGTKGVSVNELTTTVSGVDANGVTVGITLSKIEGPEGIGGERAGVKTKWYVPPEVPDRETKNKRPVTCTVKTRVKVSYQGKDYTAEVTSTVVIQK